MCLAVVPSEQILASSPIRLSMQLALRQRSQDFGSCALPPGIIAIPAMKKDDPESMASRLISSTG